MINNMDKYLYIKSDESNTHFSDNQVYRFKIQLSLPLALNGNWRVALTEFYADDDLKARFKSADALYIYSDLCTESVVHGTEQPLLRRLNKNTRSGWDYRIDTPYYLPVKKKELREFQLYIRQASGTFASDLKQPLHLTLHLRQYPFL